ncbi:MAG: cyclase family protein [Eubacteriales bacterium]|nr:cyclase family protein [Eubacteriales bacterium]MDD4583972.1 cyclase family protein [Eubacteriales bacterium]
MRVVDLTQLISEDMPVFPGTEQPKLQEANTIEVDGFRETLLIMYSHTGTHMDTPGHIVVGATTLDEMPAGNFVGKAVVVDCTDLKGDNALIDMSYINKNRKKIDEAEFVLFNTGWNKKWGTPNYFGRFPVIDSEVTDYLIGNNKKGIGVDVISIEPIDASDLPVHHRILGKEMVIVENLMNLELLGDDLFTFCALPLKFKNSDGAPVRAIAILEG